jgi:hypothetical protein
MKTISVTKECKNYDTYRTARVKSLFNAEYGHKFSISVDTDIDEFDWQIGVVPLCQYSCRLELRRQLYEIQ